MTPESAEGAAILGQVISQQAELISYLTVFNNLGLLALATIPLLFFCKAHRNPELRQPLPRISASAP